MNPPDESHKVDEELLLRVLQAGDGDLRAFEELVLRHQKRITADCRYLTKDDGAAEDLAQEIFVKVYFGIHGFERRSSFRHWLQTIKVHHCLNHLKKQKAVRKVSIDDESASESAQLQVPQTAQRDLEALDDRQLITSVLESLPDTLRITLVMRDMDELSYEEIATELGIGLSAVKMRIKRAREEFRRRYRTAASTNPSSMQATT